MLKQNSSHQACPDRPAAIRLSPSHDFSYSPSYPFFLSLSLRKYPRKRKEREKSEMRKSPIGEETNNCKCERRPIFITKNKTKQNPFQEAFNITHLLMSAKGKKKKKREGGRGTLQIMPNNPPSPKFPQWQYVWVQNEWGRRERGGVQGPGPPPHHCSAQR